MRLRGKVDRNQPEIVRALRQAGISVLSLADIGDGCPDLLAARGGKTILFEVKDPLQPPSKQRLTDDEKRFHRTWTGEIAVITSAEEALKLLNN